MAAEHVFWYRGFTSPTANGVGAPAIHMMASDGRGDKSTSRDRGFPWGDNTPTRKHRVIVALAIAALAGSIVFADFVRMPDRETDFSQVRFAAAAMLEGRNPYELVGPGREFQHEYPLFYPAPAFVAAIPFTLFSDRNAAIILVAVSSFLLAYGITAESWHLLPLFLSAAFVDSVHAAQWTIILTAAVFLPWLAFLVPVKPQSGGAVLAGATTRTTWIATAAGALVLITVSFLLLPGWLGDWLPIIRSANHIKAPIAGPFGFLILFVLLRWRRPETWLVFASACLPQTFMWYSSLLLLSTAATYREACVLSVASTAGFALTLFAIEKDPHQLPRIMWGIYLCSTYFPVVIAILRRRNDGEPPVWLKAIISGKRRLLG